MKIFKTDNRLFWLQEAKSWLLIFLGMVVAYFIIRQIPFFAKFNFALVGGLMCFSKLARALFEYHVNQIQIDTEKRQMAFVLASIVSGKKVKKYDLARRSATLVTHSGFMKYLKCPAVLKVFVQSDEAFVITNRYGFSVDTLTAVDKVFESLESKR